MSAENWLEAVKTEEQRLLAEIVKTTLYKQLDAVRTVIAVYEGTSEPSKTPEQSAATIAATRTNGHTSRHTYKTANAFRDPSDVAADASSRPSPNTQPSST